MGATQEADPLESPVCGPVSSRQTGVRGIRHGLDTLDTLREDVVDLGKATFGPMTAATTAVDVTVI